MLLAPDVTYLNTGSYGITPRVVFDCVTEWRRLMQMDPVDFIWRRSGEWLWPARERLGQFIGANPRRVIFTANVSTAINLVAWSLQLAAPGDVLMTDHEYGAMHFAWERAAQHQALNLRYVTLPLMPSDPTELVDRICGAITPRTRVLFVSHVLHTTGMVLPLHAICAEAHKRGVITVVDGAHAPGMLDLNLDGMGCDYYAANLHKWLCAPVGAGFLFAAHGMEERLRPMTVSWGWHYERDRADQRDEFGGTPRLRSFEFEGSRDVCAWLTVPHAIAFQEKIGLHAIRQRHGELSDYVRSRVDGRGGVTLATPAHPELRGGLTAFQLPAIDAQAMRQRLWENHKIEINVLQFPHGQYLRISTHVYNLEREIDLLADVLPAAMQGG